ncbi:MAG: hypothetical protein EOO68_40130 [Moraxellaceae bacterium]|nr:MAG: hypothetical protein EOO68_40130 [Moraxellaceae bacterium]
MTVKSIRESYSKLPKPVRTFVLRGLFIFICWKLLYDGFLQQRGIPDRWLTGLTGDFAAGIISKFYKPANAVLGAEKAYLYIDGKIIVAIADGCNGLELLVTFLGFLFCLPTNPKRFWQFALPGITGIFVLNIIRCIAIAWLNINHRSWVDIAHHYIFQLMVYAFIFFCWARYSKYYYAAEK